MNCHILEKDVFHCPKISLQLCTIYNWFFGGITASVFLRKSEGASLLPPEWSFLQMVMLQRGWNDCNLKEESRECCIFLTPIPQKSKTNFALNESQIWKKKENPEYKGYGIFHFQVLPIYATQAKFVLPKIFSRSLFSHLNNLINGSFIAFLEKTSCVKLHCHCYYLPCAIETKLRGVW